MLFERLVNFSLGAFGVLSSQTPLKPANEPYVGSHDFDWAAIKPNTSFQWHSCFGDFKCARLQVPMDWQGQSSEANKTVEIAVIKVETTVPVTDPSYGGAVVLNPGGPGGSGIGQVLKGGKNVRTVVSAGPDAKDGEGKNFDVIGFDPRGVNNTTPYMGCFPDSVAAAVWQIEQDCFGYIGTSSTSFDNLWASRRAMVEGCSKRLAEEGIAKHVSTAPVARDILEIFERHGEWREQEAKRLLQSDLRSLSADEKAKIRFRTAYQKDKEMVQYWGFSYGTILGATLSAMYPDRIHRAILDGVADAHDYMAGGWTTNLADTDLEFIKLAEYCWLAGPSKCPLYDEDGPAVIIDNVAAILAGFVKNPIGIPVTSTHGPEIVTYDDLKRVFREIVYNPLSHFTQTSRIIAGIRDRNGTALAAFKYSRRLGLTKPLSSACLQAGPYSRECNLHNLGSGASSGIACTDGLSRLNQTKEEYRDYASKIQAQSRLLGEDWATIQIHCTAWHVRPEWRYEGNFTAKTAHPLLFIGNTIDPVTPLRNAFLMAKGFEGAGVLHQDSEGHCTYGGVSLCSGRAVREYFQTGKLPAKKGGGTKVCGQDRLPLDGYEDLEEGEVPVPEGEEGGELWRALVGLNKGWA